MRLGIFGGTFDPIHTGHLILAEFCRDAQKLDRVLFVPAGTPPHKRDRQITSTDVRKEMVEMVIAGHPAFQLSTLECDRDGPSYTVDTLQGIQEQFPDDELFLILGQDMLSDLVNWYQPEKIIQTAHLIVGTRPGYQPPPADDSELNSAIQRAISGKVDLPGIEISSSMIRHRIANGQSVRYTLPRAVEALILAKGLYERPEGAQSSE